MLKASLVATLLDEPSSRGEELAALPNAVEWLEVRADLIGDPDVEWLRRRFRGRLIYTLQSRAEGGRAGDDPPDRAGRLQRLDAGRHEEKVTRLERIFERLDASPRGKKCKGMEGLIEELRKASSS